MKKYMKTIGSIFVIVCAILYLEVQASTNAPKQAIVTVRCNVDTITVSFLEGNKVLDSREWSGNIALYNKAYEGQKITIEVRKSGYYAFNGEYTIEGSWLELDVALRKVEDN